jgi:hypothetical protein
MIGCAEQLTLNRTELWQAHQVKADGVVSGDCDFHAAEPVFRLENGLT